MPKKVLFSTQKPSGKIKKNKKVLFSTQKSSDKIKNKKVSFDT